MPSAQTPERIRTLTALSVIIPVGPGETCWRRLLEQIADWDFVPEIIAVFADGDEENARDFPSSQRRRIVSPTGRAIQMNAGARAASNSLLWFLHADSQVDGEAANAMWDTTQRQPDAIHFLKLAFADDGPWGMKLNAWGAWCRSRLLGLPFGDQGICLSKKLFMQLGEYDASAPFGEDHLLVWQAHRHKIPVKQVAGTIVTSARKYADRGWLRTTRQHMIGTWTQALPEWIKMLKGSRTPANVDSVAVAIFVKTPGHSPVKTRLSAEMGVAKAEQCYRSSVQAVEAVVCAANKASPTPLVPYWAVAESEGMSDPLWRNFDRIVQPVGGLGERLSNIYDQLVVRHRGVIFLGADSPQISPDVLIEAVNVITERSPFVIGPALDGGFYLFGGSIPLSHRAWTNVVYSSDETCAQLCGQLKGKGDIVSLAPLRDIDQLSDLNAILDDMAATDHMPEEGWLAEQKRFCSVCRALLEK